MHRNFGAVAALAGLFAWPLAVHEQGIPGGAQGAASISVCGC
jgi:hypothetical protein